MLNAQYSMFILHSSLFLRTFAAQVTQDNMNYGFVKIATAIPRVKVADPMYNAERIASLTMQAMEKKAAIVVFPELSLTGYTCGDLIQQQALLDTTEKALMRLLEKTRTADIAVVVGLPVVVNERLADCAAVLHKGCIKTLVAKTYLQNSGEHCEKRWYISASDIAAGTKVCLCGQEIPVGNAWIGEMPCARFAIEFGADLNSPIPPSCRLAMEGADIILCPSSDSEGIGSYQYMKESVSLQSRRCMAAYAYVSGSIGESTTDAVYGSRSIIAENGHILAEAVYMSREEQLICTDIDVERLRIQRMRSNTLHDCATKEHTDMQTTHCTIETSQDDYILTRHIAANPFYPSQEDNYEGRCSSIYNIQIHALASRMMHINAKSVVVGISGGLDSTLALLVCVGTFDLLGLDRKGITGITMPGFGTTDRTYTNAMTLMQSLGITIREISIKTACEQHFKDIGHDMASHNVTYENAQARERTQILMDVANDLGAIVVGTGDLSELALGWATYNGDHMSMYAVNASVPKTMIQHIVRWVAGQNDGLTRTTLLDIVDTPISPELLPANSQGTISQKTEDLVGPYELHDFFIYYTLRWGFRPAKILFLATHAFEGIYDRKTVKHWLIIFLKRFMRQQYKRNCMPDGPKTGSVGLSSHGQWHMPSDVSEQSWTCDLEP